MMDWLEPIQLAIIHPGEPQPHPSMVIGGDNLRYDRQPPGPA